MRETILPHQSNIEVAIKRIPLHDCLVNCNTITSKLLLFYLYPDRHYLLVITQVLTNMHPDITPLVVSRRSHLSCKTASSASILRGQSICRYPCETVDSHADNELRTANEDSVDYRVNILDRRCSDLPLTMV